METLSEIFAFSKTSQLTKSELVHWRWLNAVHMFHIASLCKVWLLSGTQVSLLSALASASRQVRLCEGLLGVPGRTQGASQDEAIWNKSSKGHSITQQVLLRLEWLLSLQRLAGKR